MKLCYDSVIDFFTTISDEQCTITHYNVNRKIVTKLYIFNKNVRFDCRSYANMGLSKKK